MPTKFKDPVVAAIFASTSTVEEKPLPPHPVRTLDPEVNAKIRKHVLKYAHPDHTEAWKVVFWSFVFYYGALAAYPYVPFYIWMWLRACTSVRMFILQHDCAHGSFFSDKRLNFWVGVITGSFALTPMQHWRKGHLLHHRVNGDLDQEDPGKTILWTNREFNRFSKPIQRVCRVLRDPFIFPIAASLFFFVVRFRFPDVQGSYYTNFIKGAELGLLWYLYGKQFLVHESIAMVVTAAIGVGLFHFQHSVNTGYNTREEEFDSDTASILGSTYLIIPSWLKWMTLNIEYHHIHHYSASVPLYFLRKCHEEAPEGMWDKVTVVSGKRLIRSFFNVQWNEDTRLYESFPEYEPWLQKFFPGL